MTIMTVGKLWIFEEPMFLIGMVFILIGFPALYVVSHLMGKTDVDVLVWDVVLPISIVKGETKSLLNERGHLLVEDPSGNWYSFEEVFVFTLGGERYEVGFLEMENGTRARFQPMPARSNEAFEAFRTTLDGKLKKANEKVERLQAPVIAPPDHRHFNLDRDSSSLPGFVFWLSLLVLIIYGAVIGSVISDWENIDPAIRIPTIMFIVGFLLASWLFVYVVWVYAASILEDGVEVHPDRISLKRGDRVLRELKFERDVVVEVISTNRSREKLEDAVMGYGFVKGMKILRCSVERGYPQDAIREMWPMIMTAAWEHKMLLGWKLRELLIEKGD
jgi:hypothetical protein